MRLREMESGAEQGVIQEELCSCSGFVISAVQTRLSPMQLPQHKQQQINCRSS